jgi:hypothetical protein
MVPSQFGGFAKTLGNASENSRASTTGAGQAATAAAAAVSFAAIAAAKRRAVRSR